MSTYAKDIIQAAVGARTANDAKKLADPPELIRALSRRLQWVYAEAAKVNPWYFSVTNTVTGDGTKWARPAGATVFYAFGGGDAGSGVDAALSGGTDPEDDRVHIVPLRDLAAEIEPRIYLLGRDFYSAGGSGDPSPSLNGDKITFVSSFIHGPLDPTVDWDHANNLLDSSWPEHHNNLLIAEIELWLAKKDGRTKDVAELNGAITKLEELFLEEIASDNQGVSARWGRRSPHVGEG